MSFEFDSSAMAAEILGASTREAMAPVLAKLCRMPAFISQPENRGHKLFMSELDAAIPHIADVLGLRDYAALKSNDNVCIIATQFYNVGGHTRVAADISRIAGADATTIIVTDLYGNQVYQNLTVENAARSGFHCRAMLALKAGTVIDRVVELHNLLHAIRPTRIFLLLHHMDLCALTAAYAFRGVAEFVHHADHLPAAGSTMAFSAHVDLTSKAFGACRDRGLEPIYAGMRIDLLSHGGRRAPIRQPGSLRLATCGHPSKFEQPARRAWVDWVLPCLRLTDATISHIGPATETLRQSVSAALAQAGIDAARYAFRGAVPRLQDELIEQDIDVFLTSYPEAGGRANLEALAAGVPVVMLVDAGSPPLLHAAAPLPGLLIENDPGRLPTTMQRALRLRSEMAGPAYAEMVRRETQRFEDYVLGAPVPHPDSV